MLCNIYAAPGDSPRNVTLTAVSDSEIFVSWEPPSKPNGIIRRYKIELTNIATANKGTDIYVGNRTYETLKNLLPNTLYKIQILAETARGPGPLSQPVNIRTKFTGNCFIFFI